MTGRELIEVTGAVISKRQGKRRAIKAAPTYRAWARRHQQLLRDAFRRPDDEIDLTVSFRYSLVAPPVQNGTESTASSETMPRFRLICCF